MGLLWEESAVAFAVITVLLCGGAAWMTGQALARTWRELPLVLFYMALLGAVSRFFHWGLAGGSLLSVHYYLTDTAVLMLIAAVSWRLARTTLMVSQYPWLYRRTGPLSWTDR
ncbi:MAG: DUF6867 family protein [Hyphomicrobiaceae bacterium]|jgi:hypothetical protein